ncbi:phosphopantetheine-binding protein [Planobispora siamensis]|uniref:Carrier domain-containing protein n=1 Tax=Planobispora siamensis TaxID=936338 RepID=A0A8J3S7V5_9ACTN|nr:acyl carrier protein [Planobispora siamensis]GIH89891.1 hypothetical protein Psi01_05210 [Planobispora siamensis]
MEEIVVLIMELLAQMQDRDPGELRIELEQTGEELPVDSLLMVEILTRIEARYGIAVSPNEQVARSTRAVYTFAATILEAITERHPS